MNAEHLVGTVLNNRYEILEVMGVGGMAAVYKAKCRVLNRLVAVKMLKDSMNNDAEVLKRFKTESMSTAKLSHHNIVGIYDVGEENGSNYIVMELVDGITLKDYISKRGVLNWKEASEIAMQIGLALQCAHENNIIHRDIKPHNILITKDNTIKVADFGIARAVSSDTMITGKETMGSVRYISPEQARGGYVDCRSDIYSLGVVLYEMLTGKVPFDGENPVSIAMMKLNDKPIPCNEINPDIPQAIADITMRAISKEQHYRYQSAIDIVSDLRAVSDGGQISKVDERETVYTGRRKTNDKDTDNSSTRKKTVLITAIAAVVLSLTAFLYFGGFFSGNVRQVVVPEILGMTLEEAEEKLAKEGFKLDKKNIEYEYDTTGEYEENQIMRQDPGINKYMNKNTKIKITISRGFIEEGEIPIPKVVNMTYEDAEKELKKLGLKARKVEEDSDTVEEGKVISQSPEDGEKAVKEDVITLVVSIGPKDGIKVPGVVGKSFEEAKRTIEALELRVLKEEEASDSVEAGKVIRQIPDEGKKVAKNGEVHLVVSSGMKDGVEVKNYVGDDAEIAKNRITDAGLKVNVKNVENDNHINKVISQSPTAGSKLKRGDTVTLEVGVKAEAKPNVKYLSIQIPDDAPETVNVKVVANGKEIYNEPHKKSEVTVDIKVEAKSDAKVQVYFDGVFAFETVVEF